MSFIYSFFTTFYKYEIGWILLQVIIRFLFSPYFGLNLKTGNFSEITYFIIYCAIFYTAQNYLDENEVIKNTAWYYLYADS